MSPAFTIAFLAGAESLLCAPVADGMTGRRQLARFVPRASLAAVPVIVAWNMSERHRFAHILATAPLGERNVPVVTFALTVLVDLTLAIAVGVVLAAILFMHGMAYAVSLTQEGRAVMVRMGLTDAMAGFSIAPDFAAALALTRSV